MADDIGEPLSDARQTLLRAMDHLDEMTEDHGAAKKTYLVVAYAHQIDGATSIGWSATDDPNFAISALAAQCG
jgi:hypothetical protein